MALQVPSGLITQQSGANSLPLLTTPIPVVIVGSNSTVGSGNNSILGTSGYLNVLVVSGSIVNVSGDIVLVVSGGTIQVSGVVGFPSGASTTLSGLTVLPNASQSGQLVILSGGGAGFSGVAMSASGNVVVIASGFGAISGLAVIPNALQSGQAFILSGGVAGLSGLPTSVSGNMVGVFGYTYTLASGATASGGFIVNIASGRTVLHTVSMITTTALGFVNIQDATSGNAGNVVANYSGVIAPVTFIYDALLTSGLQVVVVSGASFAATVTYKNPA